MHGNSIHNITRTSWMLTLRIWGYVMPTSSKIDNTGNTCTILRKLVTYVHLHLRNTGILSVFLYLYL